MPLVQMPDGTVKEMSLADIEAHNASLSQQMTEPQFTTPGSVFADRAVRKNIENLLNLPGAAGSGLAHTAAGLRAAGAAPRLALQGESVGDFFNAALQQEQGRGVAGGLNRLQDFIPDTLDVQASLSRGDTAVNREELLEQLLRENERFPNAAAGGNISGDVMSLLQGRAGIKMFRDSRMVNPPLPAKDIPSGTRALLDDIVNSKFATMMRRGTKRSGEVGLEGAAIALLNDGDPITTAGYAAGTQAAGSLALTLLTTKTGLGLVGSAALGTALLQMFDTVVPGGDDFILPNIEGAFNHLASAIGIGMMAGMAGTGRIPTGQAAVAQSVRAARQAGQPTRMPLRASLTENLPNFADAITQVPRGVMVSMITDATDPKNPNADIQKMVIRQMAIDPEFFGTTAGRRIARSMTVEGAVSLKDTIESLLDDKRFREKLDELSARAAPVDPLAAADQSLQSLPSIDNDPEAAANRTLATLASFGQ